MLWWLGGRPADPREHLLDVRQGPGAVVGVDDEGQEVMDFFLPHTPAHPLSEGRERQHVQGQLRRLEYAVAVVGRAKANAQDVLLE